MCFDNSLFRKSLRRLYVWVTQPCSYWRYDFAFTRRVLLAPEKPSWEQKDVYFLQNKKVTIALADNVLCSKNINLARAMGTPDDKNSEVVPTRGPWCPFHISGQKSDPICHCWRLAFLSGSPLYGAQALSPCQMERSVWALYAEKGYHYKSLFNRDIWDEGLEKLWDWSTLCLVSNYPTSHQLWVWSCNLVGEKEIPFGYV